MSKNIFKKTLINELKLGEKARFISDYDREKELKKYHIKYLRNHCEEDVTVISERIKDVWQ